MIYVNKATVLLLVLGPSPLGCVSTGVFVRRVQPNSTTRGIIIYILGYRYIYKF